MSGTITPPTAPEPRRRNAKTEELSPVNVFDDQPTCKCGCGQKAQNCPNQ